jgi:hypothetical protein
MANARSLFRAHFRVVTVGYPRLLRSLTSVQLPVVDVRAPNGSIPQAMRRCRMLALLPRRQFSPAFDV